MLDINVIEVLTFGAAISALLIAARALKINEEAWQRIQARERARKPPEANTESATILSAVSANQAATAELGGKVDQVHGQLRGIVSSAAEQHLATHRTEQAVTAVEAQINRMDARSEERHAETIKEIRKKPRGTSGGTRKSTAGAGGGRNRTATRTRTGNGTPSKADRAAPASPQTSAAATPETADSTTGEADAS